DHEQFKENPVIVPSLLEQAAKEVGGLYTNRKEITGKDGGPVQTVNSEIPVPMEDYLKARREVLDEY
ncbi:phage domain protein, partial [Acinetobacter baumannii 1042969-1197]